MPKNLFYKNFFVIQYIPKNKNDIKILIDIYTIRYNFINKNFMEIICQMFEIKS